MANQIFEPQTSLLDVLKKSPDDEPNKGSETPTQCIVKDFLSPGQIVQIKAPGCGTWLACEIARGIAEGGKVLSEFEAPSPGGVLIIQGGMSHEHFTERLSRMTTGTQPPPIRVISPVHFTSDAVRNLCDENVQDGFFKWLTDQKAYEVLILDGIDGFLPDKPEPQQISRLLVGLRGASMTVVSIESDGRGGLPLFPNQPDLILNAKALDGFDDLVVRVDFEKSRSLKPDQQKTFFIKLDELDDGKLAFVEAPMDEYLKAKTLQLLTKGWTQQKIARETGKDQSTISRWINSVLVADSLVVKDGRKYLPTKAGRKLLGEHNLNDF